MVAEKPSVAKSVAHFLGQKARCNPIRLESKSIYNPVY